MNLNDRRSFSGKCFGFESQLSYWVNQFNITYYCQHVLKEIRSKRINNARDEQFQCKYWRTVTFLSSVSPLEHWLHWHRLHRHSVSVSLSLPDTDTECWWNRCQCGQCSSERFTETAHPCFDYLANYHVLSLRINKHILLIVLLKYVYLLF